MTTIIITSKGALISAKNGKDFPRLSENVAARTLLDQDVFANEPNYRKGVSNEKV